jgi:5-methylcytosine-specific restriction enzyme A
MTQGQHHKLYATAHWKRRSRLQLLQEPLCAMCLEEGRVTAAEVAHHVERHGGNSVKFFTGKLASLCKRPHDSAAARAEHRGFDTRIDVTGFPTDPRHPFYRGR